MRMNIKSEALICHRFVMDGWGPTALAHNHGEVVMRFSGSLGWSFGFLAFYAAGALAQQSGSDTQPTQLPAVTVEGEAINTAAQRAIEDKRAAPNAMTVIEAEQLNQFGDQPLGDALRRLPGVTFPGGNRARDVQLRGVGVEYSQVLVNGRALIDGNSKRSVQVDRIPSSMVERVEIVRAPLASQDGQGAAGTVNIILKNQNFTPRGEIGAGVGYLDENGPLGDATFLQAFEAGPLRAVLSGGIQRQRRNESKDTLTYSAAGAPNGGTLETNERRFDQINLTPSFELLAGEQDILRLEPSYLRTRELRNDVSVALLANQVSVNNREVEKRTRERENYGLYGAWTHEFDANTDLTLSLDYQQAREDTLRRAVRYTAAGVPNRVRDRTESIELERYNPALVLKHLLGGHELQFGTDYSNSTRDEDNTSITNGVADAANRTRRYGIEETRWNAFAQDSFRIGPSDRLTYGMRLEDTATAATDFFGASTERDSFFVLPSAHYVHNFAGDLDFRAGLARTLRRPDLRELSPSVATAGGTAANPDTGGNPNLTPESIWGADIGLDQYFWGNRGLIGGNVFARHFTDKIENIQANEAGRIVSRGQNVGTGKMFGLEVEGRLPLDFINLENLTLWANATRIFTEVEAKATGQTRRFLDQPDYVGNIGIDWFVPMLRTTFGASVNLNSGYRQNNRLADGTSTGADVGVAARVDLSARVVLTEQVSLNLSALNVFAASERRTDRTYDAAGALTAISTTDEPTYRSVYMRLVSTF